MELNLSSLAYIKIKIVCPLPTDPKYPADSKKLKKVLFFLSVTTVHCITFYSIYTETIAEKLIIFIFTML